VSLQDCFKGSACPRKALILNIYYNTMHLAIFSDKLISETEEVALDFNE
jgi:hypothetical protein